jgi:class 3 adenylate cyclase/tetratricopeptide (TPR) repeat protein
VQGRIISLLIIPWQAMGSFPRGEGMGEKKMQCPHCQYDNTPSANFCIECGCRLAPDQEISKALPEERKFVTVLFVDISRFALISEQLDPEELRDLINGCFDHLLQIVKKYGGKLEKYVGDAIMAVFGVPLSHENDPERALRAGLEMMESISDFNSVHDTDLNLHVGINTGIVIVGGIGISGRHEVMGDAVNIASRLKDLAKAGQILAGPTTYRLTRSIFSFQEIGPIILKGKTKPVLTYRLLSAQKFTDDVKKHPARKIGSPLVGRNIEFSSFIGNVGRLLAGQGGIISVIGDAGLGKSRLLAELKNQVTGWNLFWLEGRAVSFSKSISYWPFLQIIKTSAEIGEEDTEGEAWEKLERRVTSLFPGQVSEILPYLASLLALEVRNDLAERVKYLDGEAMGKQIFRATRRFFKRLSLKNPLLLVFEDLQWADQASADLLEHLLPLVREVPMMICCVSRRHHHSPGAYLLTVAAREYADRFTEIPVIPLSAVDSAILLSNLMRIKDPTSRLGNLILQKAEGNPFFLEEVVRSLIDTGVVEQNLSTRRWQIVKAIEHITIPHTLRGVIVARIDSLAENTKEILKIASVIGRTFFYRVLEAVCENKEGLQTRLENLQQLEIIYQKNPLPELAYSFKHALTLEVTYDSILLKRRRELHHRVGKCFEELFAGRLEEFYGLLAYHFAQAENWEKAQDYLFKAADRAVKVAADAEALSHYQQAVAAYERAFGDRWNPFQRAVLERKMGEAFFRRGEHHRAAEYMQRALTYMGNPYPISRWNVRLAIARQLVQQLAHRWLPALFMRHAPVRNDRAVEEHSRIFEVTGWINYFIDRERLLLDAISLLNFSEESNFSLGIVQGCLGVGLILDHMRMFRLAERYHQRAVSLAEQIRNPIAVGLAYLARAIHRDILSKWETAIEDCQKAAEAFWSAGNLRGWGGASSICAELFHFKGDSTRSFEVFRNIAKVGQEGADRQIWGWGLWGQGLNLLRSGVLGAAEECLRKSLEMHMTVPDYQGMIDAKRDLARCYLYQSKLQRAFEVLEKGERIITEQGLKGPPVTRLLNVLAETHLAAAERFEGSEKFNAFEKTRRACVKAMKAARMYRAGLPHAYRIQGSYEWCNGKPVTAQKCWQQSLSIAQKLGAPHELGTTYLEMGSRTGESLFLKRAEIIFDKIGAKLELLKIQQLLNVSVSKKP